VWVDPRCHRALNEGKASAANVHEIDRRLPIARGDIVESRYLSPMSELTGLSRHERIFPAGHVLFEQGEAGSRMFIVRKGLVRIFRVVDGDEFTLATLGPGEFFGEMALLEDLPRNASARTESACLLIEIDEPTFEVMLAENAGIAVRMMRKLSARIRELDARVQRLTTDRGLGRAIEVVREAARGERVLREHVVRVLVEETARERFEVELMVHDLLRAGVLTQEGDELVIFDQSELDRFARFLELRHRYEGMGDEVGDAAARRMARLLRALDLRPDEDEKNQTVLARHFQEYQEMKARFG